MRFSGEPTIGFLKEIDASWLHPTLLGFAALLWLWIGVALSIHQDSANAISQDDH